MITLNQIEAALGLLRQNRTHLAEALGVKSSTFNSYFKGTQMPASRLAEVEFYFIRSGIEFIKDGVRLDKHRPVEFNGKQGFCDFYDEIYKTALKDGGDICLYNAVSDLVEDFLGDHLALQVERMQKIKDRFRYRVILEEGDNAFLGSTYCEYKWYPKNLFNDNHFYIFGSKVGFVTFEEDDVNVIMIDNQGIADTQKHLFDVAWDRIARDPDD